MKVYYIFFLIFFSSWCFSQNSAHTLAIDTKYREDQFYATVTYNLLNNKPNGVSQNGFSSGFHLGFIRDMPINNKRNVALGIGLGLSSNSYNQNIQIASDNSNFSFEVINETNINVTKNKFTTYLVEIPIELRWRTSNATDYDFWRIYTGFKMGYLVYNSTKFISDSNNFNLSNIEAFNTLQYGITLSAGYGIWNFHAYYSLNSIFDNTTLLNNQSLDLSAFKLGLMFYIL